MCSLLYVCNTAAVNDFLSQSHIVKHIVHNGSGAVICYVPYLAYIFGEDRWGVLEKEEKKCELKWCGIAKADTFRSQGKGTIWCEALTEVGMKGGHNSRDDVPIGTKFKNNPVQWWLGIKTSKWTSQNAQQHLLLSSHLPSASPPQASSLSSVAHWHLDLPLH